LIEDPDVDDGLKVKKKCGVQVAGYCQLISFLCFWNSCFG